MNDSLHQCSWIQTGELPERRKYILERVLKCLSIQNIDMTTLRFNSPEQMITKGGNISDVGCSISNCRHKDSLTIGQSIMNYCAIRHTRISVPPPRQALTSSSPTQTWQSSYLQIRRWIYLIGGDNLPLPPINTHGTISERTFGITEVGYHVLPYDTITSTPGNAVRVGGSGHL